MPPAPEPKGYSVNRFVCKSCVVCLSLLPVFLKNPPELEQFSSSWAHFWRLFGCLEAPLATILPSQEALGAPKVP